MSVAFLTEVADEPTAALSSLAIIASDSGTVLFEKHWSHTIRRPILDELWAMVECRHLVQTVLTVCGYALVLVMRGPVLLVGALSSEVPPLLVLELLHRVADLLELYLRRLTEKTLRINFLTVYQVIDEAVDNGAPLHTEPGILQQLVMSPDMITSMVASVTGASQVRGVLPEAIVLAPWRRAGVRFATNELYLDLIERLDVTVENSILQRAAVRGDARCSCQLSGKPRLTLSFSSARDLEDVVLHNCLLRQPWVRGSELSFIPPDGVFRLLSYRVRRVSNLPLYVTPQLSFIDFGRAAGTPIPAAKYCGVGCRIVPRGEAANDSTAGPTAGECGSDTGVWRLRVAVGSRSADGRSIDDLVIRIPFPPCTSTSSTLLSASIGAITFDEHAFEAIWTISRLPGGSPASLTGTFTPPLGRTVRGISLSVFAQFKMALHSCSGLKVEALQLENEEYRPYKGVRTMTTAGVFEVRTHVQL